jgi:hypothetical protein
MLEMTDRKPQSPPQSVSSEDDEDNSSHLEAAIEKLRCGHYPGSVGPKRRPALQSQM